jgi:hypothetical protein
VRAAAREPALARPAVFAEATEHPATQLGAAPTVFTPPGPQRQSPMAEEPAPQHTEAEPTVPLASRQPAPRASREPRPPGVAAGAMAEHNSAEAAQRLVEAVLLRSRRKP